MYIPRQHEETRTDILHGLMREYPLATIVTHSSSGLNANHIPLYLSEQPKPYGTLRGHVARANSLLADLTQDGETLVIFHGPDCYITPSWYASKKQTGKVAPTWNYAVVHAYGVLRTVEDTAWLHEQLEVLTNVHEASFSSPWAVQDAPEEFINTLMQGIVGIEMVISKLLGKWKVNQNQPVENQASVVAGLRACALVETDLMADMVESNANKQASDK